MLLFIIVRVDLVSNVLQETSREEDYQIIVNTLRLDFQDFFVIHFIQD